MFPVGANRSEVYPHGGKVRERRLSMRLTQAEVARRAHLSEKRYQDIERGLNTSIRSLRQVARALECEIEELTGRESIRQITPYESNPRYRLMIDMLETVDDSERDEILDHAIWSAERARPRLPSSNLVLFPTRAGEDGDFPPPPIDRWIEKDTDVPRPLHAWVTPIDASVAAGVPIAPDDWLIPTTQLLNSLRELRDDRVKVVKIFGHSMHPTLRNGWKVLLDPSRSLFQPGKIVMVYIRDEGTTIGLLATSGEEFKIVKRNPDYGGPPEIPLLAGEWYPVGTVTTIVEAPVEVE